jgi:hypothetical protein
VLLLYVPTFWLVLGAGLRGFILLAGLQFLMYPLLAATRGLGGDAIAALDLPDIVKRRKMKWLDIYASADPVPNGPLFINLAITFFNGLFSTFEVYNRGSILTDHTVYWKNREHFVGEISCALADLANISLKDEGRFEIARRRRRWRVPCLVVARWSFIIIGLVTPLLLWRRGLLRSSAADLPQFLSGAPKWIVSNRSGEQVASGHR